ncbi:porin, partial [Acinetobacter baumannii]
APLVPPTSSTYPGTVGRNSNNWNIGLVYGWDRWRAGVQYAYADAEAIDSTGRNRGKDRYNGVGIGGAYSLGPGISLTAG